MNTKDQELLGIFMGLQKIREGWTTDSTQPITDLNEIVHAEMVDETWYVSYLRFDESWDWLMTVVSKIHSMGYRIDMIMTKRQTTSFIYNDSGLESKGDKNSLFESIFESVLEFVKEYNKKQKK